MDPLKQNAERSTEKRNCYDPLLESLVNPNYSPQIMSLLEQVQTGLDKETAHNQIMEMLVETASKDQKTGLFLEKATTIKLTRLMGYSQSTGIPLTIIYLDADNFKRINDEINHAVGDKVIKAMAQAIKESTRKTDVQARLSEETEQEDNPGNDEHQARMGGDEFLIVLPKADPQQTQLILNRFNQRFTELMLTNVPEYSAAFTSPLTVSAGIVQYDPIQDKNPADLILRAEMQMKQSKHTVKVNGKIS